MRFPDVLPITLQVQGHVFLVKLLRNEFLEVVFWEFLEQMLIWSSWNLDYSTKADLELFCVKDVSVFEPNEISFFGWDGAEEALRSSYFFLNRNADSKLVSFEDRVDVILFVFLFFYYRKLLFVRIKAYSLVLVHEIDYKVRIVIH